MSRLRIIAAIMRKDLVEFSRDRVYVLLSVLGLVVYIAIFWVLPSTVDETLVVGVHGTKLEQAISDWAGDTEEGLRLVPFPTAEALRESVEGRTDGAERVLMGIDFADDFMAAVQEGRQTSVTVLVNGSVPNETRIALSAFVREIAFAVAGHALPVTQPGQETVVLGIDRAGDQIPFRDRLRPFFAFFVLLVESFALASLVSTEIQQRTVTALLVTPVRTGDVLAAKGLTGTLLAFTQAVVLLAAVRAFGANVPALLVAVLLGAIMVTGLGMISGAAGKDFMGTLFFGMVFMIPMAIPAMAALYPGSASSWVQVIPTYGVVQAIFSLSTGVTAWGDVARYLLMSAGWCVALFGIGMVVLKHKVESL